MTPAEFEWECEKLEIAYEKGNIGKLTFIRRMGKLGFSVDFCRNYFKEIESQKE